MAANLVAVLLAGSATGCLYPNPPDDGNRPELAAIVLDSLDSKLRAGGVLSIAAYPVDTSFRLSQDQRVAVEVETSEGDAEVALLYRRFCPPRPRSPGYLCHRFIVHVQDGNDVDELRPRIAQMGGRFVVRSSLGDWASVVLFEHSALITKAQLVARWREVESVELEYPGFIFTPPSHSALSVPVPVDTGPPSPRDGIVQLRSGSLVTVRYTQPGGSVLSSSIAVP